MDKPRNDRISELCSLIEAEKDPQRILNLVQELDRLLSAEQAAHPESDPPVMKKKNDEGKK